MKTPGELYQPSSRSYPTREPEEFEYPDGFEVRRIRKSGDFKWRGGRTFVTETLAGESIGLERISDDTWQVYIGPLKLGTFHERALTLIPMPRNRRDREKPRDRPSRSSDV